MTDRTLTTPVLVIGAGPTGMLAALCLAKRGVASVLLERREGLETHPKAHELSARSIEILHDLGFSYDEIAAEASSLEDGSKILFCGTIAEELGCIDLQVGGGARKYREHLAAPMPYLNVSQVELEKVIRARVLATPEIRLLQHHQWESFEEDGEGITSLVTDRTTGETLAIRSRYALCADGAGSRTRKALGVGMVGPDKLLDVVNAYFQADLSHVVRTRGKLYFIFSPKAPASVFMAHHVEKRWVFHLPIATPAEKVEDYTPDVMVRKIKAALGRDDVDVRIQKVGETILGRYHRDPAVRERVLAAIEDQRSHFDRIGLDLGYTYDEGALLPDGTPAPATGDHVSTYTPSTRPGARFPHFWLDGNKRARSSRALLDYRVSTLILGASVERVPEDAEALAALESTHAVRVVDLAKADLPPSHRAAVHAMAQLDLDGALLVRPDGHVAWRQQRGVTLSTELVASILDQVYRS